MVKQQKQKTAESNTLLALCARTHTHSHRDSNAADDIVHGGQTLTEEQIFKGCGALVYVMDAQVCDVCSKALTVAHTWRYVFAPPVTAVHATLHTGGTIHDSFGDTDRDAGTSICSQS